MADNSYQPEGLGDAHPLGCVVSWVVNLIRPPAPAYARSETKDATEPTATVVAKVRGVLVERAPTYQADGSLTDDGSGPVIGITLVVDDDEAAAKVLDAIHDGTPISVLSGGRG